MTDQPQPQSDSPATSRAQLAPIGGVVAIGGFALLAVEVIRTLTGGVLGTIATVLLWVGVGLLAVGLLLLVLSLAGDDAEPATAGPEPLPEAAPAIVTAVAAPAPVAEPAPVPVSEPPSGDPVAAPAPPAPAPEPAAPAPPAPAAPTPPAPPAPPVAATPEPPAESPAPAEQPPSADGR